MNFRIDLKLALLALTALALGACSTVPQENCTTRLAGVPKAEDGTRVMDRDDERVLSFYTCRAAQGDKQAQLWLGEQYEQGSALVEADQEKAFKLYMQAATDDPTRTSIYVAGIKDNPGTVMSFANPGARPGLPEAKYRVGRMYFEGRGVKQSTRRATRWMKQAAKRGHMGARIWLEANG